MLADELKDLVGNIVVVDSRGTIIYIGKLRQVGEHLLVLEDVDVHSMGDSQSNTTKEVYILESKKFGVRTNRKSTRVWLDQVLSISLLDEVIEF